jgi:beta-glucanase (GH16 family)
MRIRMLLGVGLLSCVSAMASDQQGNWRLVWGDEFETEGAPDSTKWGYEKGMVRNREKQFYTAGRLENARVESGRLILEARKESYEGGECTSASVTTRGKASWTYGRVEVKAKLPQGRGVWPSIWMLGENIGEVGWPACGEIDIMEYVGFEPDTIYANVHMRRYNHARGTGKGSKLEVKAPYEGFHVYAVEWYPERMEFFVDDTKYFTFTNEGGGEAVWPFDQPQYLILNVAIGGTWGGQKGIDDAIFPQRMEVEYVRVYERKQGG